MPALTTRYRVFPSKADLAPPSMATLLDHSALTLSATPLSQQDPGDPPRYREFAFLFWNLRGSPALEGTTADAYYTVPDVGTAALTATAWYVQVGGGGGDGEGVSTVAFSDDADDFLAATPIAAVTPAGAWAGGDATAVSTRDAAVRITARPAIDGREHFEHWLVFGAGAASGPDGAVLAVPRHGASLAIATYKTPAPVQLPAGRGGELAWILLGGVAVDAGGLVLPVGGGPPRPVGPWGPAVLARLSPAEQSVAVGLMVHGLAAALAHEGRRANLQREALHLVGQGLEQLLEAGGKG